MNNAYSWKPTPDQTLLLKACLLEDSKALESWEKWCASVSLEEIDLASFRLLPLLYWNLKPHRIQSPIMNKLKGVYRQTWCANQLFFDNVFTLLAQFAGAGIPTLLLKGAPLVLFHYKDYGLRPMIDIDVLIPTSQYLPSMKLLDKSGWHSERKDSYEKTFWFTNTVSFKHNSGARLELHWYAISQSRKENIDENFWRRAVPVVHQGVKTLATCPSDTLFHVCIHGAKWAEMSPIRWIADAIQIMKTSTVDWNMVIEEGKKRRLIVGLRETLFFLRNEFDADIHSEVLKNLSEIPLTKREVAQFHSIQGAYEPIGKQKKPEFWIKYKKMMFIKGVHPVSWDFIFFLQHWWNLTSPWQVFFYPPVAFCKWLARIMQQTSGFRTPK